MGKNKIEIFTSDCPLCKKTVASVKEAVKDKGCGCEIVEQVCSGDECCQPAKNYDIKAVPTVVIDGKIALVGQATATEIKAQL